jgi:wobble nucleotide-excising tRNase
MLMATTMAINQIARLRNCGIFVDFSWPSGLPDFKKYNLVYGWNGTGKTTLSRVLRSLETRSSPTHGDVRLVIDNRPVDGSMFPQAAASIRVFNRDFVQASVFSTDGTLAPIFVLGKENVEKQKRIEDLRKRRELEEAARIQALVVKGAAETAIDKLCIDEAKNIKDLLRSTGANPYNNYDKATFRARIQKMIAAKDPNSFLLEEADRESRVKQLSSTPKSAVATLAYTFPDLSILRDRVEALLSKTVVSAVIDKLREAPVRARWVHEGLSLYHNSDDKCCAFCDQPLPAGRLAALEAHFSDEYERLANDLERLERELHKVESETNVARPNRAELYDDLGPSFVSAETDLLEGLLSVRGFLKDLFATIKGKRQRMFEAVRLDVAIPPLKAALVSSVNAVISKHNAFTDKFQSHVVSARKALEDHRVAATVPEFIRLSDAEVLRKQEVADRIAAVKRLDEETRDLEREVVEHLRPAQELNSDLLNYLGHDELKLEVNKTGYSIHRRGVPAQSLSEGERTAIALLYFLKSLEDKSVGGLSKAVVVLDDPVSSLGRV